MRERPEANLEALHSGLGFFLLVVGGTDLLMAFDRYFMILSLSPSVLSCYIDGNTMNEGERIAGPDLFSLRDLTSHSIEGLVGESFGIDAISVYESCYQLMSRLFVYRGGAVAIRIEPSK
jgi:hypothetical protein